MPSELVCERCGRPIDADTSVQLGNTVAKFCEGCAGWQRARATDQEDRYYNTGLDARTPVSRPTDPNRRT